MLAPLLLVVLPGSVTSSDLAPLLPLILALARHVNFSKLLT